MGRAATVTERSPVVGSKRHRGPLRDRRGSAHPDFEKALPLGLLSPGHADLVGGSVITPCPATAGTSAVATAGSTPKAPHPQRRHPPDPFRWASSCARS